jgi:SPFH domain / Band 7 family
MSGDRLAGTATHFRPVDAVHPRSARDSWSWDRSPPDAKVDVSQAVVSGYELDRCLRVRRAITGWVGTTRLHVMRRMAPDWLIQLIWFIASVFATGAIWYFLSQHKPVFALWSMFGAAVTVLLAVTLLIQNDLARRQQASLMEQRPADGTSPETNVEGGRLGDREKPAQGSQRDVVIGNDKVLGPPIRVKLADHTTLDVELSLQFQVKAEDAPKVVSGVGSTDDVAAFLRPLVEATVLSELSRLTYQQLERSLSEVSAELTRSVAQRARDAGITVEGIYITKLTRRSE